MQPSWFSDLDPHARVPLFVQIAQQIADQIRRGRMRAGERIPSSRALADALGVNRNTVAASYRELLRQGWIASQHGRGTFVSEDLPEERLRSIARKAQPDGGVLGFPLTGDPAPQGDDRVSPGVTKWDFGSPDVRLCPTKELVRAYRYVLRDSARNILAYDRYRAETRSPLQAALADMLRVTRGVVASPDAIEVTRGSQMAIYLVTRALVRPGDTVAIEDPGYYAAVPVLRECGANVVPVPVDEEGLIVSELEAVATRQPIRAVFVTPHHQFPTTVTLSTPRRLALLRLAKMRRMAIIEDDFDHEFHYDGRPVAPLASYDSDGLVIHVGSLSKVFAPGLRLGYVAGPERLIHAVRRQRALVDGGGDAVLDAAIASMFRDGEMQRHLNRSRRIYRERRDAFAAILRKRLGHVLTFQTPAGGVALWAEVDRGIDVELWADRARSRGLLFRTARLFYLDAKPRPYLRLGFARWTEREVTRGLDLLVRALPSRASRGS